MYAIITHILLSLYFILFVLLFCFVLFSFPFIYFILFLLGEGYNADDTEITNNINFVINITLNNDSDSKLFEATIHND